MALAINSAKITESMADERQKSIGVFDSGIGGLTVVRALMKSLPNENLSYFGDTARVPYGTKSEDVIRQYAYEDAAFLVSKGVKVIVVACNTVSSVALDVIESNFDVPVIGMIHPGAAFAMKSTTFRRIGVIGTFATVGSDAYTKAIHEIDSSVEVSSAPCPLFVPLAEEGWDNHPAAQLIADEYLEPLRIKKIDTLILGCTHYPILKNTIQRAAGDSVTLIDSGEAATSELIELLTELNLLNPSKELPNHEFYVSDFPQKFKQLGDLFLGKPLNRVSKVHI
jgi:glutamate racemase